jgi:hypothetical protein
VKGYVVDHLSLTAGLTEAGSEYQRREFSRLIYSAAVGGPALTFPALCLAAATAVRAAVSPLCALMSGNPILTTDLATYQGVPVDVVAL